MKINGKIIADNMLEEFKKAVDRLNNDGVTPKLAVILVGDNPASISYIKQKQKAAERIGAAIAFSRLSPAISQNELQNIINVFNNDSKIHGIIVQRPLPPGVGDCQNVLHSIVPEKDVDGFVPDSPFEVPVASAVLKILQQIHKSTTFISWLRSKHIVIIGRGETAGKPIADHLKRFFATSIIDVAIKPNGFATFQKKRRDNQHCTTSEVNSKTKSPGKIIQQGDVVISCVGKSGVVKPDFIKHGAILISVGIWRDESGKLHGDYEEDEIKKIAGFYTPTPGGVGPVNVACLMANLVEAARSQAL
ncbi:bifunctional 5,10-methylenetetrahydrofolate dehydrogenase/5,10-methenyltetrahydrofolate cyclohydrolase [Patescibacteria group bacterium]|nr:bifunctional 5,10-methylenetetrahydrofolate dehydrogenase/5,10-methenyltetrahydrofolate cyclohydrolase [Patescibacteria group bacterium]MBU1472445.1 bifunctional 5,10-methylenetetrahydrofolate dehydrogenase/5,10-methenyltetrahydrofolate cyclohydrolase [Patescibacteria group bacterium]MBU2460260.1 bifunctional 5,10-methylenetetrahydrofolate dehydrogenase/5,10-methenyltetrahydrofolate cyclohydrolase [Patescibacteria group bacterium]MBU2543938.1 bifunctional 5,10-methylenetetrahydrofolate dehydr